jgi:antitoxin component of MazEF toxin-antitoxin module
MELVFRKLGNSTGLTFPVSFLREHHLSEGQVVSIDVDEDGTFKLRPVASRKHFTAAELNAQCDPKALMPEDLVDWDRALPVGTEFL